MKKNEVAIKCKLEADAVAAMLLDLANSFKEGKVVIQKGASFVTLRPAGVIEVEIEAVEKKGKQKIEIKLAASGDGDEASPGRSSIDQCLAEDACVTVKLDRKSVV